jgi:hypothetical protein
MTSDNADRFGNLQRGPDLRINACLCHLLPLLVLSYGLTGCGGGNFATVDGKVTRDAAPIAGAEVLFEPEVSGQGSIYGKTDHNGICMFDLGGRKGFVPGKYKVTVTRHELADGNALPPGEEGMVMKENGKSLQKSYLFQQELQPGKNTVALALDQAEVLSEASAEQSGP